MIFRVPLPEDVERALENARESIKVLNEEVSKARSGVKPYNYLLSDRSRRQIADVLLGLNRDFQELLTYVEIVKNISVGIYEEIKKIEERKIEDKISYVNSLIRNFPIEALWREAYSIIISFYTKATDFYHLFEKLNEANAIPLRDGYFPRIIEPLLESFSELVSLFRGLPEDPFHRNLISLTASNIRRAWRIAQRDFREPREK